MTDRQPFEPGPSASRLGSSDTPGAAQEPLPWEEAAALICRARRILIIGHVSPDGDAIGSLLGLGLALKTLDKTATLACESPPPAKFSYLAGFSSIVDNVDALAFDLVIGLDSSDPARLGNVYQPERLAGVPLINIDHHITNLYYGDVNIVNPGAGSTAEMLITLLDHLGIALDANQPVRTSASALEDGAGRGAPGRKNADGTRGGTASETGFIPGGSEKMAIATCLLTGIVTDTVGFRTPNVTPQVMHAAMRMMNAGASLVQVMHYAFNQRPLIELRLLARGLDRVQVEDGLAWSEITLADRADVGYDVESDAGLVGMLVRTKEVHIAAVFTEKKDNKVEISFRADPGYDIAQVALSLGGGGHAAASGCTIEGPLEAAKARVLPMLRAVLSEQRQRRDAA